MTNSLRNSVMIRMPVETKIISLFLCRFPADEMTDLQHKKSITARMRLRAIQ